MRADYAGWRPGLKSQFRSIWRPPVSILDSARLSEYARDCLDSFQSLSESCHALAMPLELAVRKIPDAQIRNVSECWPPDLCQHFRLSIVRRDDEHLSRHCRWRTE